MRAKSRNFPGRQRACRRRAEHKPILTLIAVFSCALGPASAGCQASAGAPPAVPQGEASGITGTVLMGPLRGGPVISNEPDEKPFRALFHVRDLEGREVVRFESNDAGEFEVAVPAGTYIVTPDRSAPLMSPEGQGQRVDVPEGEVVEVTLRFDTGIR